MRRGLLLVAIGLFLCTAPAQARPWLSKHDARHALHWYAAGAGYVVRSAARKSRTGVFFKVGFTGVDLGFRFEGATIPASFKDYIAVKLRHGHIWVDSAVLRKARWR